MKSLFEGTSYNRPRRGVTLLFVIGLITLFVLLGTTFLVVSVHYMRGSKIHNTGTIQWDDPSDQQRTVLYSLFRGTTDNQSSLLTHDLLTDMYDVDNTFFGVIGRAYFPGDPNTNWDDTYFQLPAVPGPGPGAGLIVLQIVAGQNVRQLNYTLSDTTGAYNGQYLTFLDGPTRGTTVQVVEYIVSQDPNAAGTLVRQFVIRPTSADLSAFTLLTPSANVNAGGLVNARVLINSRPFNGRGFGQPFAAFPVQNPQLTRDALVPNRRDYYRSSVPAPYARVAPRNVVQFYLGQGKGNESYDAVDFQNMALSALISDPNSQQGVIPSFHRPSLVNYWRNNSLGSPNPPGDPNQTDPNTYAPFMPTEQTSWDPNNNFYPLSYREFRRQVIMRPMPWDHPNFSGGNANLVAQDTDGDGTVWDPGPDGDPGISGFDDDGINGTDDPGELGAEGSDDILDNDDIILSHLDGRNGFISWDVDNDGDLVPDSIWIDVGLPVQVDSSGRYYKPLAAILVSDLDGRININAAGSRWQLDNQLGFLADSYPTTHPTIGTNGIPNRGQGYGPAEINMRGIFQNNAEYRALLFGESFGTISPNRERDSRLGVNGRYGPDNDINTGVGTEPTPGRATMDFLTQYKFFDTPASAIDGRRNPGNGQRLPGVDGSFGSHADLQGRLGIGINGFGQPIFDIPNIALEKGNSQYEMDLSRDSSRGQENSYNPVDQPYSPGELERVLRGFDSSVGALPDRLVRISSTLRDTSNDSRLLVTTDSYDVPVPHEGMFLRKSIVEEYRFRLGVNDNGVIRPGTYAAALQGGPGLITPQNRLAINFMIRQMLAPELILGNRMNINRPFGNGIDDNNNGVVDEHWDAGAWNINEAYHNNGTPETIPGSAIPFDHDNNGLMPMSNADTGYLARHYMARHLYIMMMLLADGQLAMDFDGDNTPTTQETPFALAQLAINVVDFRDSDSIMTPFEFDSDPFDDDGWSVNGDLDANGQDGPDRQVVWGIERPEMLITEAFATHDRRTENLPDHGEVNGGGQVDDDFDQRLRPQGSLFIELYNPWNSAVVPSNPPRPITSAAPAELYAYDNGGNPIGIDLRKRDLQTNTYPVWRIAIARPDDFSSTFNDRRLDASSRFKDPDPLNPNNNLRMNPNRIERTIYFSDVAPPGVPGGRAYVPTPNVLNELQPVRPNGYAVIGSAGRELSPTQYVTTFGRRTDVDEMGGTMLYDTTRSIWLNPGQSMRRIQPSLTDPTQMEIQTRDYDYSPSGGANPDNDSVMPVPIPLLSISEPVNGYTPNNYDPNGANGEGAYLVPIDQPLDEARIGNTPDEDVFNRDGTHRGYRILHLQRLANPLAEWNATTNPYRTIDSATVDLTIFHGTTNLSAADIGAITTLAPSINTEFATDERGESEVTLDRSPVASRQLWPIEIAPMTEANFDSYQLPADMHYHNFHLFESLGQLNDAYRSRNALNANYVEGPRDLNGGANPNQRTSLNANQRDKWTTANLGGSVALSWYTFNNRPFVSQHEMMMVPKGRSSRTLYEYTLRNNPGGGVTEYDWDRNGSRFGHLANFYQTTVGPRGAEPAPHLYQLFDLTHVPTRFTKSERYLSPPSHQQMVVTDQTNNPIGVLPYNAPFNLIEERREPGKINVNTIFDRRVYDGLMGQYFPGTNTHVWPGPTWNQFIEARRGYPAAGPLSMISTNGSVPSLFANPYRDGNAGNLVVQNTMIPFVGGSEVSLLRRNPANAALALHDVNTSQPNQLTNDVYRDSERNAYFKEYSRFRLTNMTTTRSNVYAVWITLGYFEYDPTNQQLGQELGSGTGDINRHRSFHIIDRSIPVGYEPGENHNVDKAILVERFIE